jgi:tetratricopeptide (TPR) repeat protein
MTEPHSGRLQQLLKMLEREPNDAFLLYGIAIEYKNLNESNTALEYLDRVLQVDPNHSYTYYQQGQVLEGMGETERARERYQAGIESANRAGDGKARGELEAALDMLA